MTHPYDSKSHDGLDDGMRTTRGHEITVVLLAYNCAHRIVPVLEHLVALQPPIVAVDNGSKDGTASVLASFEQVELVRLPENIGAACRNAGVDRVRAPYVLFCDDDGWYEADGLPVGCDLFERHPNLALINAKIVVGAEQRLDPISREMAESPVPDRHGLPGAVLLSFMAGAVAIRTVAYKEVGGYDPRYFIGGEEETLSVKLAKADYQMRYVPDLVMHHLPEPGERRQPPRLRDAQHPCERVAPPTAAQCPSLDGVHARGHPKNLDFVSALALTMRATSWILRERAPMRSQLDGDLAKLDARRFANRRSVFTARVGAPKSGVNGSQLPDRLTSLCLRSC